MPPAIPSDTWFHFLILYRSTNRQGTPERQNFFLKQLITNEKDILSVSNSAFPFGVGAWWLNWVKNWIFP
jgi:hypothetical protein